MLRFVKGEATFTIAADVVRLASEDTLRDGVAWELQMTASTAGKRGARPSRARFRSRSFAYRAFHERIASTQRDGYVLEVDGMPIRLPTALRFTAMPDLERIVEQDPSDEDAWLVLADAWSSAGDPRGECIALERTLVGIAGPAEFVERKRAVAASRHACYLQLFGSLGPDAYRVHATFERGLVHRIELPHETAAPGRSTVELVEHVLADPFARFAKELVVIDGDPEAITRVVGDRGIDVSVETIH